MKRRLLASCLLPVALAVSCLAVGTSASSATVPAAPVKIKVMVNGDSITQEFNGDYTWRYRLVKEIARQGVSADFVGPNKWPYGGSQYYRVSGWDHDHDAIGGSRLTQHLAPDGAYKIIDQLTASHPDILISFLATNDLLDGLAAIDPLDPAATEAGYAMVDGVVDNYATFIDQVREITPNIKIVLGEVMTVVIPPDIRDRYNGELAEKVVAAKSTPNSPIALAQLDATSDRARWSSGTYTYDWIHPTPTGELLIAQRFATALHSIAPEALPQPPAIPQVNVAWNPILTAKLRVASRRIYVSCTDSMRKSGILGMRVKLYAARTRRTSTGSFQLKTSWNSAALAPGYYRVQVQGLRSSMTTPWTKSYTVRVPKPKKKH